MSDAMNLTFLGAAGTVTGSKYLVGIGERRLLVDAGMFQGEKRWREVNWDPFPISPSRIGDVVLTHAHMDHCGYLPALVKKGFTGRVWCTEGTRRLAEIVLMDAGHLQEREAEQAAEGGYSKHEFPEPLYTVADVEATLPLFQSVDYDTDVDLGAGLTVRFTRAGHILGSANVTLSYAEASVLFSGDLGRHDHPILRSRDLPSSAPFVLLESTYGDREHPDPQGPGHEAMAAAIRDTIRRGGSVLIPAFAVDRTAIVLKTLASMRRDHRIPEVPIFVNSPMAVASLAVYREGAHEGELRPDLHLEEFLNLPGLTEVTDAEESKRLNTPSQPCIIVSSSGMATGGRVLHHLEYLLPNPKNSVILTGYQGVGTRGRQLLDGATEMKFRGRFVPVRAQIVQDSEFSVHADASDLIDWLAALSPKPQTVFCVHGEEGSATALAARIRSELGLTTVVPRYGEVVSLVPGAMVVEDEGRGPDDVAAAAEAGRTPTPVAAPPAVPPPAGPTQATSAAPLGPAPSTHDDDADQIAVILETALGQVPFLPEDKQDDVSAKLHAALDTAHAVPLPEAAVRQAVNEALYAAAGAVETPGGQSIVALLAHIPKVLG